MSFPRKAITLLCVAACLCAGAVAHAQETFAGSNAGNSLAATVTFLNLGGGQLQVTLSNIFTGDTVDQSHVLTGVFFSGTSSLTPVSATAGAGSVEWIGSSSSAPQSSAVLGTEWAYGTGSAPGGATEGIVSSGYYTPGSGNFASPGDMLDGSAYGILSAGYSGSDMDGLGSRQYIQNAMVFVLSGFTGSVAGIDDVSFQYGTSSSEPNVTGILVPAPEPTALFPAGLLLWAIWAFGRKRLRANRAT